LAILFLLLRKVFSSMDVPARQSYVMAVVPPEERAAAASMTNVPRSLTSDFAAFGRISSGILDVRLAARYRRNSQDHLRRFAASAVPSYTPTGMRIPAINVKSTYETTSR
jgi:hypothetical protein